MIVSSFARLRCGAALALLALAAACGGNNDGSPGNGGDGGNGGEEPDSPGGAGGNEAGGSAAAGHDSGEARVQPGERCSQDEDCDDGLYCNGRELCKAQADSDFKLCEVPEVGPCVAENCDEATRRCDCSDAEADHDQDGFKAAGCVSGNEKPDCDDSDGARFPGAAEECVPADPTHDEDCNPETIAGPGNNGDEDGDHFVSSTCANFVLYQLSRHPGEERRKNSGRDCDDSADTGAKVHPGADEVCDGLDNNCNGIPDETTGLPLDQLTPYYLDADGDTFGSDREQDILWSQCNAAPPGYVTDPGDCDDTNRYVAPSRSEVCNGIDDDCDDIVDKPIKAGTLLSGEPYDGVTQFECLASDGWHVKADGCPENRLDCDDLYQNACEVPATTLCNCHACGNRCEFSCGATDCEEVQGGSTGFNHTCFLVGSGDSGSVVCAGLNLSAQLGNGSTKDSSVAVRVPGLSDIIAVSASSVHTCALNAQGLIYCWGDNRVGQLGASLTEENHREPIEVSDFSGAHAKQIASGDNHTCALYELDGTTYVGCWGQGDLGQLGGGTAFADYYEYRPIQVIASGDQGEVGLEGASQIASGYHHTCALVGGRVMCWGNNSAWQLGFDPNAQAMSPIALRVPGLENVDEIAAAANHTCARVGSDVYCWGLNDRHQLATDGASAGPSHIPLPNDIRSLAAGSDFACALRQNGAVLCWGSNVHGERGTDLAPILPSLLPIENVTRIFSGQGGNLCAINRDGITACLGQNDFGQLAKGTTTLAPQPTPAQISPLVGEKACTTQQIKPGANE